MPAPLLNHNTRFWLACATLIAVGGALRLYGLHWGDGQLYHPDEHNIAMAVTRLAWPDRLDPEFHAYNGLAIYSHRVLAELAGWWRDDPVWAGGWHGAIYAGRWLSAVAATLTVALLTVLGHTMAGRPGALALAGLAAFQVGLIQAAHFATTESLLVLFLTALSVICARLLRAHFEAPGTSTPASRSGRQTRGEGPGLRGSAVTSGIVTGLACATKTTALGFVLIPVSTLAIGAHRFGYRRAALALLLGLSVTVFVALVASPFTLLEWAQFRDTMRFERGVVDGSLDVFWTLQFIDTTPYLFQILDLPWLIGPLTLLLVVIGAILVLRRPARFLPVIPLLLFGLVYTVIVGGWHARFVRYSLPLVPTLMVLAAVGTLWCWRYRSGRGLVAAVLISNLAWALAFTAIYSGPDARTRAWVWLDRNAAGARVLAESHDVAPAGPAPFMVRQIDIYAPDDPTRAATLARELATADYFVLLSRRGEGTLPRLPERFAVMSRFYRALREGTLGYIKVARFDNYPRLAGLRIRTDAAEQTFQVFDHPQVTIFANKARHAAGELERVIAGRVAE